MIKKYWPAFSILAVLLLMFSATARAADATVGADGSLLDAAKPVWEAVMHGQYWMGAALALVLAVALFKRYAPGKLSDWAHTDQGASLLVLLGSFGGALATGLAAVGTNALTGAMAWTAVKVAVTAAGGYALLKKMVVDPYLKPLALKAPPWLQMILNIVFFMFDKKAGSTTIADAEKAGDAAVLGQPSTGVAGAVGEPPTEVN